MQFLPASPNYNCQNMRKIISLTACLLITIFSWSQQGRLLDQPMQTKSCNIKIIANAFVAKTFVELEYYNPHNVEMEGLRHFSLLPGQVITGFKLELHGKYRDGSIEERWKASNAYNSIVGKRIDPALLQLTYDNNYRLNIYPFAPKGTRKISFTITEILKHTEKGLVYELPLKFIDSSGSLKIDIEVNGKELNPQSASGLLNNYSFVSQNNKSVLHYETMNTSIKQGIGFLIPFKANQYHYLVEPKNDSNYFSLRMAHDVPKYYYASAGDHLAVFWDISASAESRNIDKEILFLHSYIVSNKIEEVNLYTFNQELKYIGKFDVNKTGFSSIRTKINQFKYGGSTNFSAIDFSQLKASSALVFSDGVETRRKKEFLPANCQVNFIISSIQLDYTYARKMTERNGGSIIYLNSYKIDSALKRSAQMENTLYEITEDGKPIKTDRSFPIRDERILMTGNAGGSLQLKFGNRLHSAGTYHLSANVASDSSLPTYDIIQLINKYEYLRRWGRWEELLLFGLENKVVTAHTAFIVLERIEDYINYKIAPPKELEEECRAMNYVYRSEYRRRDILKSSKETMLSNHFVSLKNKMEWWSNNSLKHDTYETAATEKEIEPSQTGISANTDLANAGKPEPEATLNVSVSPKENTIAEVVVTSAFNTKRTARSSTVNSQVVSSDQLNVIRPTNLNDALAGKVAGIQVRSQSSAKLGNMGNIRLRGESVFSATEPVYIVNGTIVPGPDYVNIDDIEDVSVLQGPNAAALFGPDAAAGAIVITTKKGRRGYYSYYDDYYHDGRYKSSRRADPDYAEEIKRAGRDMFLQKYAELKKFNFSDPHFYFDMAAVFFEYNMREEAATIMENAIEMTRGNANGIYAAAYVFESWGDYKKAIELYEQVLYNNANRLEVIRDLALCYFRDQQYQLSLDTYYHGLTLESVATMHDPVLNQMLNEINALIAVHRQQLDLSKINPGIIRQYPADLYISTGNNVDINSHFNINAPGHKNFASMVLNERNKNVYLNNNKEIIIYKSVKGKYKIAEYAQANYNYNGPRFHRIVTFKNFQRPDQKIEVLTVNMSGQNGRVEIGTVTW